MHIHTLTDGYAYSSSLGALALLVISNYIPSSSTIVICPWIGLSTNLLLRP